MTLKISDGAFLGNPGKVGRRGLIHDHHGKWVKGYMRYIGVGTSIIAKFWALPDGLILTSHLGINQLLVASTNYLWNWMQKLLLILSFLRNPLTNHTLQCLLTTGTS